MSMTDITNDVGEILRLEDEIKWLKRDLSKAQACTQVAALAFAADTDPDTVLDIVGRIQRAGWAMKDGELTMLDEKGKPKSYVGPEEWVKELRSKAGHLFGSQAAPLQYAPTGGGQQGGGQQGGGASPDLAPGERNPFCDDTWNDTQQAAIILADRPRAERLAAAAGSFIGQMPPSMRKKKP